MENLENEIKLSENLSFFLRKSVKLYNTAM